MVTTTTPWSWSEYTDLDSRPAYTAEQGKWKLSIFESSWPRNGIYRWEVEYDGEKTGMMLWGLAHNRGMARVLAETYAESLALEVEQFLAMLGNECIKE